MEFSVEKTRGIYKLIWVAWIWSLLWKGQRDLLVYPGSLDMKFSVGKTRGIYKLIRVAWIWSLVWERPDGFISLSG
jgi:hypothetical protein